MRADDTGGHPGGRPDRAPVDDVVDWNLAARTAALVAGPGPGLGRADAEAIVADLRAAARKAGPHVAGITRLEAPVGTDEGVLVVDRAGWAAVNARGFRRLLEPVVADAARRRGEQVPAFVSAVGSRVTGVEAGGLLGFLSSRVLGQYDASLRAGRPAAARRAQHRRRRARAGRRPGATSGSGSACTRRPTGCSSPPCRGCATHMLERDRALVGDLPTSTPRQLRRACSRRRCAACPTCVRGDERRPAAGACADPRAARRPRPGHRGHVAARGPRGVVMDGVGPGRRPERRDDPRAVHRRRRARGAARPAAAPAARPGRRRCGSTRRRGVRPRRRRAGRHGRLQRGLDRPGRRCRREAEIADPAAWVRRVHGCPSGVPAPDGRLADVHGGSAIPAVAAVRARRAARG